MCELPTIEALLGTTAGLIVAGLVALGPAIALNNSFFASGGSPVQMGIASGLSLAAVATLTSATLMIDDNVR